MIARSAALALLPLLLLLSPRPAPADGKEDKGARILRTFAEELVPLTPGKGKFPARFTMGTAGDKAAASERPTVKVSLKAPFAMAKYEVTQELYELVTGKSPSRWRGPRNSVEKVTWDDANTFCTKVTALLRKQKLIKANEVIRLPSEAEWEYACRAGTTTAYSFGDKAADLGDYAWYHGNAKGNDPPVGKKKPNAWGLYDMHGYVWEWTADAWSDSHEGAKADGSPRVNAKEKARVVRGGAWTDNADAARSASRQKRLATYSSDAVGFRCVKATVVVKEAP
jgi:formylglycine-generating enzyme required for sulfatase activity